VVKTLQGLRKCGFTPDTRIVGMRGLRHLVGRDLLAFRDAEGAMQSAGPLYGTGDPAAPGEFGIVERAKRAMPAIA
jgi:hypothetical protein